MASGRSVEHQFYVNKQTDVRMLLFEDWSAHLNNALE